MAEPDGRSIYGTWCAVVQAASKMPVRGLLADLDGPLSPDDIATKISATTEEVERMIAIVSEPRIDWIEQVKWDEDVSFKENIADLTETRQIPDFPFMRDGNPSDMKRNRQTVGQQAAPRRENVQACGKSVTRAGNPSGVNGNRLHNITEQNRTGPSAVSLSGRPSQQRIVDVDEAKRIICEKILNGKDPARPWSDDAKARLAELCGAGDPPGIPLQEIEDIAFYRSLEKCDDVPELKARRDPITETTLMNFWGDEAYRAAEYRKKYWAGRNGSSQKKEPVRWREFFRWKYSDDVVLPQFFAELSRDLQSEYERDFQTFKTKDEKVAA